ncbi:MAG TPA: hypothetical protein VK989_09720, partial [Polyangia bacterium]|nr:hypothetical protein [Polyangia bacterium]
GAEYRYPHDFANDVVGHYVREEYRPPEVSGHRYYAPTDSGRERAIKERLENLREPKQSE